MDTCQLPVFVRSVIRTFDIVEEFVQLIPMKHISTEANIFRNLMITEITDGALAMAGEKIRHNCIAPKSYSRTREEAVRVIEKLAQLKKNIESNCDGCNGGIVFDKVKDYLESKSQLLANEEASYQQGPIFTRLNLGSRPIQDLQKLLEIVMHHVTQILEDLLFKGVNPVDFLLITFVNEKFPGGPVADWEAVLMSKEEEH
ncbi:unnamed protein product [Lepeophtheirus salmonis]|uniref:(salmon louse) hypothetical protein n=1 Tax=Lepeophtheirus salmonis TaxID=72036 RepID=A0A7R8HCL6_LEPSM|nr:unnamed protein product [Lepeophtheirus salmonis]CAF3007469.1 unnamed protein product [Lepeophtheirus salmonis]